MHNISNIKLRINFELWKVFYSVELNKFNRKSLTTYILYILYFNPCYKITPRNTSPPDKETSKRKLLRAFRKCNPEYIPANLNFYLGLIFQVIRP